MALRYCNTYRSEGEVLEEDGQDTVRESDEESMRDMLMVTTFSVLLCSVLCCFVGVFL